MNQTSRTPPVKAAVGQHGGDLGVLLVVEHLGGGHRGPVDEDAERHVPHLGDGLRQADDGGHTLLRGGDAVAGGHRQSHCHPPSTTMHISRAPLEPHKSGARFVSPQIGLFRSIRSTRQQASDQIWVKGSALLCKIQIRDSKCTGIGKLIQAYSERA